MEFVNIIKPPLFSVTEWHKHQELLNLVIKTLWEKIGREVDKKLYIPKAIVHISANVNPKDIKLTGANESKVKFVASGSIPLAHPEKLKLCRRMEEAAKRLRTYLPVLLGLGAQCLLPPIEDEQLALYDGVLKVDGDEREGDKTIMLF